MKEGRTDIVTEGRTEMMNKELTEIINENERRTEKIKGGTD